MDRERDVERLLCKLVEGAGGRCEKFIPDANSGMPDRLIMLPGGQPPADAPKGVSAHRRVIW